MGGSTSASGATGVGGAASGGSGLAGGTAGSGGFVSAGGSAGSGGFVSAGGSGGLVSAGGSAGSGGFVSAGGTAGTGGTPGSGGSGDSGGTAGTGAGGTTVGECQRTIGSCTSPTVTITEIDMGHTITSYGNESDTLPLPLAIAAMPSGGSRIAARGTDGNVYIGELDCNDQLIGPPFAIPAVDLQDLYADESGGVVMITRLAEETAFDHCGGADVPGGGPGALCGGVSAPCYNSYLLRFNQAGVPQWTTAVTNLSDTQDGYQAGARFVWGHYQHHGRIAFDGENYAAYFCIGITVNNGSCVDIHEGDRMQVVNSSGTLIDHSQDFSFGCSHSWTTRIVWDPRTNKFVMVCATDNACRIAQAPNYTTVSSGECDGTLFNGDIVLSTTPGYWNAWSQDGTIRLAHFTTGAADQTISNAGSSQHPHLASYGTNNMLLTWGSGSAMAAQVRSAGDGSTIGDQFTIDVADHNYIALKAFPDGSVAYPAAGSSSSKVKIARVHPCQ